MTSNPDFKGMPLSDIECLRNDTKQTHGHYKPLTESDRLVVLESGLGLESGLKSIFAGLGLGLGL